MGFRIKLGIACAAGVLLVTSVLFSGLYWQYVDYRAHAIEDEIRSVTVLVDATRDKIETKYPLQLPTKRSAQLTKTANNYASELGATAEFFVYTKTKKGCKVISDTHNLSINESYKPIKCPHNWTRAAVSDKGASGRETSNYVLKDVLYSAEKITRTRSKDGFKTHYILMGEVEVAEVLSALNKQLSKLAVISGGAFLLFVLIAMSVYYQTIKFLRMTGESSMIMKMMPVGLALMGPDRVFEYVNPQMGEQFQYTVDEMTGMKDVDIIPTTNDLRDRHEAGIGNVLAGGKPNILNKKSRGEMLHGLRKDGTEFPMTLSLASSKMFGKNKFIAVSVDQTKLVEKEEENKMLKRKLDEAIALIAE